MVAGIQVKALGGNDRRVGSVGERFAVNGETSQLHLSLPFAFLDFCWVEIGDAAESAKYHVSVISHP